MTLHGHFFQVTPARVIVSGYIAIILTGALLLSLPLSVPDQKNPARFVDALFTANSAVCVTGLMAPRN